MSKKLHRQIWAEWVEKQPEVHPVWESRIIPSLEQVRALAAITKADSSEVVASPKADNSDAEVN